MFGVILASVVFPQVSVCPDSGAKEIKDPKKSRFIILPHFHSFSTGISSYLTAFRVINGSFSHDPVSFSLLFIRGLENVYAPDAAVAASAVIFSGGAEGPLRMASHRTMASRWNRHWRPTLIAGSSEHSAHKHTVLGDMPSQTANCAVLRREAGRSKGTSLYYSPVTPPAAHRDPTTGTSAMEWPRGVRIHADRPAYDRFATQYPTSAEISTLSLEGRRHSKRKFYAVAD